MWETIIKAFLLCVAATNSPLLGQDSEPPESAMAYASEVRELESEFTKLKSDVPKLSKEWTDTNLRIQQNMGTMQSLMNEKTFAAMQRMQADMASFSTSQGISQQLQNIAQEPESFSPSSRQLLNFQSQRLSSIQVQADAIEHQLKTIDTAGNLAVQRHLSMIQELKKIDAEFTLVQKKHQEIINRYWEWADVEGVRSDLELSAALNQLRQSPEENIGAALAKAITFMRLEQFDESAPVIESLIKFAATSAIATALRAELYARTDEKRGYLIDLRKAFQMAKDDPRVRMHRGQACLAANDPKQAEREWEAVLKSAKHDIAAYRALSLILSSATRPRPVDLKNAKDYANLASQLAGDDWACEVALALAEAASGNPADAIAAAERAKELANGNNQTYCEQLIQKLQQGDQVSWRF